MEGTEVILLDTHVLIWAMGSEPRLGRKARALIENFWQAGNVAVSAISFWEAGLLHERRRITLPVTPLAWRAEILAAGVIEHSLDGAVALRSIDLSGLPDDPADRFIAATALVHGAALMTADERILDWQHPLKRYDARK